MTFAPTPTGQDVGADADPRPAGIAIALGLALGPAVTLGLARFAYALLLPAMRDDLQWSFAAAGAMNTTNAIGYLAGALLAAPLARCGGTRAIFVGGLCVTAAALLACAATTNLAALLIARTFTGAAGAVSFVLGGGLAAQAGAGRSQGRATLLLGVYFAGGGAGIVASGVAVPALLAHTSAGTGWRWGWILLAALAILALIASLPAVRAAQPSPPAPPGAGRWPAHTLVPTLAAYTLFGAGYIAYMTFIVAFLKGQGDGTTTITLFWVTLGVAAIAAAFAWAPMLGRLRGGRGPALVLATLTIGAVLPLLSRSTITAFISALLFGGSFLTVVTAVTALARASLPPHHWASAIATLTVAFAIGQCTGPILAGTLSDGPTGTRAGLLLSAAILAAATVTATCQTHRDPAPLQE